jgi:hypothetical protein
VVEPEEDPSGFVFVTGEVVATSFFFFKQTSEHMSILISIISVAILVGVALGLMPRRGERSFANSLIGTHRGSATRFADAIISTRYLLGTTGTDAQHVAVCGASAVPIGVISDEAASAGDEVTVELLGSSGNTVRMVASAAITAGVLVYTAASGKVSALTSTSGTYYCVGVALTAASAANDVIEVDPCVAQKTVVS